MSLRLGLADHGEVQPEHLDLDPKTQANSTCESQLVDKDA